MELTPHLALVLTACLSGGLATAQLPWWALHHLLARWHPWAAWVWDTFITYSLLCLNDLLAHGPHGCQVLTSLDELPEARCQIAMLVSRNTAGLDPRGRGPRDLSRAWRKISPTAYCRRCGPCACSACRD